MHHSFRTLTFLLIMVGTMPLLASKPSHYYRQIDSLLNHQCYFEAREVFQSQSKHLSPKDCLLIQARLTNYFNKPSISNKAIEKLTAKFEHQLSDSVRCNLLELRNINDARLGRYADAAQCIETLLNQYSDNLSATDKNDYQQALTIWQSLANEAPQRVEIPATDSVKITRDKANLANIKVSNQTASENFVFDTGANISTISESTAQQFGMKFLNGTLEVTAITGVKIVSKMALCPELQIGKAKIYNAYFLVFPDSALSFPSINYQIHGILGFPVIEALKEIQIGKDDYLTIPKQRSNSADLNLALDFLTPIIGINHDSYTFDTGAKTSMLYQPYYLKYMKHSNINYPHQTIHFGGAGGQLAKEALISDFKGVISGKSFLVKDVSVFTDGFNVEQTSYFGNLGQDLIQQFNRMTINFDQMFIKFE